jgi:tetratricopeptide (TPR) repeat protein
MGIVYEAHDPDLDRRVALKVIRFPERSDTSQTVGEARLLREAQALAQLSHPNVVQVVDVGRVGGGQLFLAMELVMGCTLTRWLGAQPRSWREIVDVFLAAGRGLAAAHAADMIHRDFKPDNVMVDDDGRVRVMDFGLAVLGDPTASMRAPISVGWDPADSQVSSEVSLTREGGTPGTPAYMSPEQHRRGEIDARCDQFSFCVALYEALYGARPFEGATLAVLAANVCAGQLPPRPVRGDVPASIHAALARGLAPQPEARFATMDGLLDALGRVAPSRRRLVWAAALVAGGGLAVAAGLYWHARAVEAECDAAGEAIDGVYDAAARARIERALLATGLDYAAPAWERAQDRLARYTAAWAELATDVCRHGQVDRDWSVDQVARATECLGERRDQLAALLEVLQEADHETVYRVVSSAAGLAELGPCGSVAALAHREPPATDPSERARIQRATAQMQRAGALLASGHYDAAGKTAEAVLATTESAGPERLALEARVAIARVALESDDYAGAEQQLEAAYFAAERIGLDEIAAEAATLLISVVGRFQARSEEGMQWARHAEGALARLDSSFDLARAEMLFGRASLLVKRAAYAEAEADHRRALTIREAALGADHPKVAASLSGISTVYFEQGRRAEAGALLESVLAIREQAFGPDHPLVSEVLHNLGVTRASEGDVVAARAYLQRALDVRRRAHGPEHSSVGSTLAALADLAFDARDYPEAVALNRQALAIREQSLGPDHPMVAHSLNNLAGALDAVSDREGAAAALMRAHDIVQRTLGPEHPNTRLVGWRLGLAEARRGRYVEAREVLDEVRDARRARETSAAVLAQRDAEYVAALGRDPDRDTPRLLQIARDAAEVLRAAGPEYADALASVETWISERDR